MNIEYADRKRDIYCGREKEIHFFFTYKSRSWQVLDDNCSLPLIPNHIVLFSKNIHRERILCTVVSLY